MTVPFTADVYQAVWPGGTVTLTQVFETYYGSAVPQAVSGAQVTITAADGGTVIVPATSTGLVSADEATYTYAWSPPASLIAGLYLAVFTGTGPNGLMTYTHAVTVASAAELNPAPGVYASVAQYREFSGDQWTPIARVQARLRSATETIDRAMTSAWYWTDKNGMPSDPGIATILMRATCAQCEFELANNDPANVKSQYSSTSMGGVQTSRTATAQGQVLPPLAPRAAQILLTSGALPGAPLIGW